MPTTTAQDTDAVIIGAGPVGLYLAFQLGLLEARCHLIDSLPYAGGQCVELYGDKPIYDIPGLPVCTGRELTANLQKQLAPFNTPLHLGQLVETIAPQDDGGFVIQTTAGLALHARALFIAAGVGAFQPRCPAMEGLQQFAGTQLHFSTERALATAGSGHLLVLGDGDAALEAALQAAKLHADADADAGAASITLMHRRDVFTAQPATQAAVRAHIAAGTIRFMAAQLTALQQRDGRLCSVSAADAAGTLHTLPVDTLLVLQGLSPKLGPIANWGLPLERKHLPVHIETFATAVPGIFAVGDIVTYPGKKKLIACGFHEAITAAFAAMPFIAPQRRVLLQYTSSSSHLQKLLGVTDTPTS